MSGWLVFWLRMIGFGILMFSISVVVDRVNQGVFEGKPWDFINYLCAASIGVGLLGTLGWFVVWEIG